MLCDTFYYVYILCIYTCILPCSFNCESQLSIFVINLIFYCICLSAVQTCETLIKYYCNHKYDLRSDPKEISNRTAIDDRFMQLAIVAIVCNYSEIFDLSLSKLAKLPVVYTKYKCDLHLSSRILEILESKKCFIQANRF